MKKRHQNPQRVKTHRNYTVEEIAVLFGIHKNTVRQWIKAGLPVCDNRRPVLILGHDLAEFLRIRRTRNKQKCKPEELYCCKCRSPRVPAESMADYTPQTDLVGNLSAICPDCHSIMNKRVNLGKLLGVIEKMDISFPQGMRHIVDSLNPSLNSEFSLQRENR